MDFEANKLSKEVNAVQKEIGAKKKVCGSLIRYVYFTDTYISSLNPALSIVRLPPSPCTFTTYNLRPSIYDLGQLESLHRRLLSFTHLRTCVGERKRRRPRREEKRTRRARTEETRGDEGVRAAHETEGVHSGEHRGQGCAC